MTFCILKTCFDVKVVKNIMTMQFRKLLSLFDDDELKLEYQL
jgi:hypothetical protein